MKILAFTDTHGSSHALSDVKRKAKKEKPDIIVCLGDFTIFGHDQKKILKNIDKIGSKILLIHGNHELSSEVRKDCSKLKNIHFIHNKTHRIENCIFLAWGGGGFSLFEPGFKNLIKMYKKHRRKGDKIILLTHGPPYGTKVDLIGGEHCGNKTFMDFIKKEKPTLALSGHLHENNGVKQIIKNTLVINPGPTGKVISL